MIKVVFEYMIIDEKLVSINTNIMTDPSTTKLEKLEVAVIMEKLKITTPELLINNNVDNVLSEISEKMKGRAR